LLTTGYAKKKEKVDPAEIRKINSEIALLKKENKKLHSELSHVDSMTSEESARSKKLHANYEKELVRKKSEIQGLKDKHVNLQTSINKEKSQQARVRNNIDELKARKNASSKLLIVLTQDLENRIEKSLPWDLDKRLERIRLLKRDIENKNAGVDESYTRLKSIYNDEIKLGDEINLSNKPITTNSGEVINAKVLKIGNQWMVYSDEEEKKFGVMTRTVKEGTILYSWKEDLNFEERDAVRTALDIKGGKKPQGLVSLPLSLTIDGNQKGGI